MISRTGFITMLVGIMGSLFFIIGCSSDDEATPAAAVAPAATSAPAATAAPEPTAAPRKAVVAATAVPKEIKKGETNVGAQQVSGEGGKRGGMLRVTSQASVPSVDGVFSGAYVTAAIAVHVTHRLFEWDQQLNPVPMLIDTWEASSDGLSWDLKVRDGITFHNGDSMTSDDVLNSLWRQMSNFHFAPKLLRQEFAASSSEKSEVLTKVDDLTVKLHLKVPFGQIPATFSAPWGGGPIIPADLAETPWTEATPEFQGTGPYKFKQWDQGDKIIVERFEDYVPVETPGGYLGDIHNQYVDGITWYEVPDEETKMAGLQTGQWDIVDGASLDFYGQVLSDDKLDVQVYKPGHRSGVNINFLGMFGPYEGDKGKELADTARDGLYAGLNIAEVMATMGDPKLVNTCAALYHCGTPLETFTSDDIYNQGNVEKATDLFKQAGIYGKKLVLYNPTDYATITPTGLAMKPQLEKMGFDVFMPAQDWATMISNYKRRQLNTDADVEDQYDLFMTWNAHWSESGDPMRMAFLGMYKDDEGNISDHRRRNNPRYTDLILDYASAQTREDTMAAVEAIQDEWYSDVPMIYLGEWSSIFPSRKYVKNFLVPAFPIYTNVWLDN